MRLHSLKWFKILNMTNILGQPKKKSMTLSMGRKKYMSTQINVVIACCTLHNFIRDELPDDDIFNDHDQSMDIEGEGGVPPMPEIQPLSASQEEVNEWHEMRDELANGMWNAYRSARRR